MATTAENGTLFSTGGDESWPVTYRILVADPIGERVTISGRLEFPPGTRLQTMNPAQPAFLRLRDGRWARVHLHVNAPEETSYTIDDRSELGAPSWAADAIREGDTLPVSCPDCGGELRAETYFAWRRGQSMVTPDEQEPFWSATCRACTHRFKYTDSGEIRRSEL